MCTNIILVKKLKRNSETRDRTPRELYAASSLAYLGGMVASNKALQWISYPTQVRQID